MQSKHAKIKRGLVIQFGIFGCGNLLCRIANAAILPKARPKYFGSEENREGRNERILRSAIGIIILVLSKESLAKIKSRDGTKILTNISAPKINITIIADQNMIRRIVCKPL